MCFAPAMPPSHLRQILATAKLSILPSLLQETFGLSIVESTLAGCPPLVSNLPSLNATARAFGGFVFSDLSHALQAILRDYEAYFQDFLTRRARAITALQASPYLHKLHAIYSSH